MSKSKSSSSFVKKFYLFHYNLISMFGWSYIFFIWCRSIISQDTPAEYWSKVYFALNIVQGFSIMELIHTLTGLVPSSLFATVMQLFVRFMTLYAVQNQYVIIQEHWGLYIVTFAHSFSEIPRYMFYMMKTVQKDLPKWLYYMRYNLFIVFYPLGLIGEGADLVHALPYFWRKSTTEGIVWSFLAFLYIPLFPYLYLHMFKQRRVIMDRIAKKKKK